MFRPHITAVDTVYTQTAGLDMVQPQTSAVRHGSPSNQHGTKRYSLRPPRSNTAYPQTTVSGINYPQTTIVRPNNTAFNTVDPMTCLDSRFLFSNRRGKHDPHLFDRKFLYGWIRRLSLFTFLFRFDLRCPVILVLFDLKHIN